ncbi:transposase, partial [Dysosmobacter sp.]
EVSMSEAVTEAGVNWKTLQKWVMQYEAEGAAAFLPGRREHIYSPELKLQAEFSKKYGLRDRRQLRNWLKVYHAHGDFNSRKNSGGGSCMRQGRDTTQEERIQIVKDCLASGKKYGEMALKYKVSYQQVRTWTLRFEEMGEAGLEDRRGKRKKDQKPRTELEKAQIEIEQLKHKLYLAEMERDLLKKLDEIVRRDASDK